MFNHLNVHAEETAKRDNGEDIRGRTDFEDSGSLVLHFLWELKCGACEHSAGFMHCLSFLFLLLDLSLI